MIRVRRMGRREYRSVFEEMRGYTDSRDAGSMDEVWLVEHPAVYTLGQTGRRDHVHAPGRIPIVATDRGGHVTYHGPGQLVAYVLFNLRRRGLGVGRLVNRLEQSVIDVLADAGHEGVRRPRAPGVYVDGRKIAAVGLRVRRGCTYHGISVNVDGDLAPFRGIDPCGYPGLEVTRLRDLGIRWTVAETGERLARALVRGVDTRWSRLPAGHGRAGRGGDGGWESGRAAAPAEPFGDPAGGLEGTRAKERPAAPRAGCEA